MSVILDALEPLAPAEVLKHRQLDLQTIEHHKRQITRLRQLGEFDYAVKREEYVRILERRLDDPYSRFLCQMQDNPMRGGPKGLGDEILDWKNEVLREAERKAKEGATTS